MGRNVFVLTTALACGSANVAPVTSNVAPTPLPDAGSSAVSFDSCAKAIAKRFHAPASWSQAWTRGPTDRLPDCHPWFDGSPPRTPVPPEQCGDSRGGWAGIGMSLSQYGWGLSDDGLTMARCNGACTVLSVTDGRVLERSKPPDSIDGSYVTDLPQNKALFRKYGLGSGAKAWPVSDAFVDWSLAPKGAAVTYHLRDRTSDAQIAIGRFSRKEEYVFPEPWMVSANGLTLLLRAFVRPENQGLDYEDAIVDLPAALTLLYVTASAANPSNEQLRSRAQTACGFLQ